MPVNLVSEDDLRAALRPCRVDQNAFEAGVRTRLETAQLARANDPLAGLSPFLRAAAALLPPAALSGGKATSIVANTAQVGLAHKLLSLLAFPAISMFLLLGATVFSVAKIRSLKSETDGELDPPMPQHEASRAWWRDRRHLWGTVGVFAASIALAWVGATWLLFLFYIISFGILLYILASYAKLGLRNRMQIGSTCGMGLVFLGLAAGFGGIGDQEIHFVDQFLVVVVFMSGGMSLVLVNLVESVLALRKVLKRGDLYPTPEALAQTPPTLCRWLSALWLPRALESVAIRHDTTDTGSVGFVPSAPTGDLAAGHHPTMALLPVVLLACVMFPLMAWFFNFSLTPITPTEIKRHVESFDEAPFHTASWSQWEVVANWVVQSKLDPDMSKPRRLLDQELDGKQNAFILSSALRTGLLPVDQLGRLTNYQQERRLLVEVPAHGLKPQAIFSLDQLDWVIRAAVLSNDLSSQERDHLEQRLHATLETLTTSPFDGSNVLETALRVTQLLDLIERPIDRDQYRSQVHHWLRKFHSQNGGGFQLAGGFKQYFSVQVGDIAATSQAIELMEIYGVPDDLDLNWVRSFLRPSAVRQDEKWMVAATRERLNHLPGLAPPSWLDFVYYERSLLAAAVLVGLCFYATLSSPKPKAIEPPEEPSPPSSEDIAAGQVG